MSRIRAARGTEDLLPEHILLHDHVFGRSREIFEQAGYREIRTPLFEETALFRASLGEVTDVVEKEMFTIQRGDTDITFRPEGTAGVVRAYLEHGLDKTRPFQKLFYMGPMFRYERPQRGRSRQFDQIGVEAIGSHSPLLDAEVMTLAQRCFEAIGLRDFRLHLNTIGDLADRDRFRDVLREHMRAVLDERCDDCRRRFERNVFRMLDCKEPSCQPSNAAAPRFLDHVSASSRGRFETTLEALAAVAIRFEVDPTVVRGFDYYTHTVFEVRCPTLGPRDAVCGGGRYDDLIENRGGPSLGATGFAIGVTPLLVALRLQEHPMAEPWRPETPVIVAPVSDAERLAAFVLTDRLRRAGIEADTDHEGKKLKSIMKSADKRGALVMLVLGPDEIAAGTVEVKPLRGGEQRTLPADDALPDALRDMLARQESPRE